MHPVSSGEALKSQALPSCGQEMEGVGEMLPAVFEDGGQAGAEELGGL